MEIVSLDYILELNSYYENVFKVNVNSLIKYVPKELVKLPFEITQFDKNIKFHFDRLSYVNGVNYIDPKINTAWHHFLINFRGDYMLNLLKINSTDKLKSEALSVGVLNNIVFGYICTSKFATSFLNTNTMVFHALENTLISNKTLFGLVGQQFISKMIVMMSVTDWNTLNEYAKIQKSFEIQSEILTDMFKISSDTIKEYVIKNDLLKEYENLNIDDLIKMYTMLLEVQNEMNTEYFIQYNDLKFKSNAINKDYICQILYDVNCRVVNNKLHIDLKSLTVNSNVLKQINLKELENYKNIKEVLEKIETNHGIIDFNLEKTKKIKN